MTKSGNIPPARPRAPGGRTGTKLDQAFDDWLDGQLQRMFDDVAREPISPELLKLIDEHAEASKKRPDAPKSH